MTRETVAVRSSYFMVGLTAVLFAWELSQGRFSAALSWVSAGVAWLLVAGSNRLLVIQDDLIKDQLKIIISQRRIIMGCEDEEEAQKEAGPTQ